MIYSFIKNPFCSIQKKEKKEVIFILHPPRSSYDTRKNVSKRWLHRAHFPKILWITTLPNIWRKTCFSKTFNKGFSMKGKVKDPTLRTVFNGIIKTSYFEKICKLPWGKLNFYLNRSIRNSYIILINLDTSTYTA